MSRDTSGGRTPVRVERKSCPPVRRTRSPAAAKWRRSERGFSRPPTASATLDDLGQSVQSVNVAMQSRPETTIQINRPRDQPSPLDSHHGRGCEGTVSREDRIGCFKFSSVESNDLSSTLSLDCLRRGAGTLLHATGAITRPGQHPSPGRLRAPASRLAARTATSPEQDSRVVASVSMSSRTTQTSFRRQEGFINRAVRLPIRRSRSTAKLHLGTRNVVEVGEITRPACGISTTDEHRDHVVGGALDQVGRATATDSPPPR